MTPNFVPIPNIFLDNTLPEIGTLAELKIILLSFRHDIEKLKLDDLQDLTGLSRTSVIAGLVAARRRGAIAEKEPRSGYVYVLRAENGLYKIGMTTNDVSQRVRAIRNSSPIEVVLIFQKPCSDAYGLEWELHELFAEKCVRGEWFNLTPEDVEEIKNL